MKILPLGAEVFHADGLTDMTKLIVAFRNSANAPKHTELHSAQTVLIGFFTVVLFLLWSQLCTGGPCAGACPAFRPFSKPTELTLCGPL